MKVLITGITGFAGSHLADFILDNVKDAKIFGIERPRSRTDYIRHIKDKIIFFDCDIRDASSVKRIIKTTKPDRIFHLAAQTFVPTSWSAPQETLTTNIIGQLNIFEAIRDAKISPLIQIAGSSEEYGLVREKDIPIKETCPLAPLSPYAVSKVGQDFLGYQYFKSYGLKVARTRAFNHTGPRRGEFFCCSNFAMQIVRTEKGLQKKEILVGNLKAVRDFTDVRDMVKGYWLSLSKGKPGEVYNICSGKGYSVKEILDILLSLAKVKIKIKEDNKRMRPSDVPKLIGDNSKFTARTGWKPKISFRKTMEDLLNWWREQI
ncbi:MAG: GDP-mannose 4,6-dehydratase [Candidatus Omnitrophica bacterium]|nr:GDP-mannose 4,6-dehydratase [Candidatus Omnitrophota bacterium]